MATTQLFSNNASTTLSAGIGTGDTSLSVADGSVFNAPTGADWEMLTLSEGSTVEIVKLTARSGNTLTVTRAQEGTSASTFTTAAKVEGRVTKGTLQGFVQATRPQVEIGASASAGGGSSVSIGDSSAAAGGGSVAVGTTASAGGANAVAVGDGALSSVANSIAVGHNASISTSGLGGNNVVVGALADANNIYDSTVVGYNGSAGVDSAVAIGSNSICNGVRAAAVGRSSFTDINYTNNMIGMAIVRAATSGGDFYPLANYCGAEFIVFPHAGLINLAATASPAFSVALPANCKFFPSEVGVIITEANTITGQPSISFGGAAAGDLVAATPTSSLTAVGHRHRFTSLSSYNGITNLQADITAAATATTMTGRFYFKGFLVRDE